MSLIKLGNPPKTFSKSVEVTLHDGKKYIIPCVFKYRTITEFGKFLDAMFESAKSRPAKEGDFSDLMEKTRDANAEYLHNILDGWGLDTEFNLQSLQQLSDELPGAVSAIMNAYREAIKEGHAGN